MAAPEKRRISAQQLLSDFRSGLDCEQLKQKHGLSDKSLESVFRKLVAADLVTEEEIRTLSTSPSIQRSSGDPQKGIQADTQQKCPSCNAPLKTESRECPSCGVVVAKYLALKEQGSLARRPVPENASRAWKRWLLICCVLTVVIVSATYLFLWLKDRVREKFETATAGAKSRVSEKAVKQSGAAAKGPSGKDRKSRSAPKAPNIFAMTAGALHELVFTPGEFPLGLPVTQGSGGIHFFETPDPNQGFKKFPPETDAKRYYDEFTIAGQAFLMITEASSPPKIYFDANHNGDMTDDPGPFEGEIPHSAAPNHYTLELPYKWEETAVPYRLWLFPSRMGGVRFYPKCYWVGQIELGGNAYKMVTFDGNSDGDYSNDPLIIDLDNDGKAADSERLRPGESLSVSGTEVKLLAIAPSGRWVRLQY